MLLNPFNASQAAVLINQLSLLSDGLVRHHPGSDLHGAWSGPRISGRSLGRYWSATLWKRPQKFILNGWIFFFFKINPVL